MARVIVALDCIGTRLRYLQCVCYWDTDLSWAINLYIGTRLRYLQCVCYWDTDLSWAINLYIGTRLRYLQCVCYWDTDLSWAINLYDLLNLAKLGSRIMACCLTATGHWSVCVPLQITLELSLGYLVAFNLISLEMQNITTEMWPRQNGCHLADGILKCIFFYQNVCIFINN